MTKTDAKNRLKELSEKLNVIMFTMNAKKATPRGMVGFPDHVIIGKVATYFIEVKIGNDRLSDKQLDTLIRIENGFTDRRAYILTEKNIHAVIDDIVKNETSASAPLMRFDYDYKALFPEYLEYLYSAS